MGTLTYRIRLHRRLRAIKSQAFRPEPFTPIEWAILIAQSLMASAVIWAAFVTRHRRSRLGRPPECIDAIDTLLDQSLPRMQFIIDVLSAYVDFPNENLEQFGARIETIIELLDDPPSEAATAELLRLVDVCRAA